MSVFTIRQHEKMLCELIDIAKRTKKETFYVDLKKTAKIYDFMNLLWDEEEMEFVLEDIFMDIDEMTLIGVTEEGEKVELAQCGVKKSDYRGDGRNLFFTVVPEFATVTSFHLEAMPEEFEEDDEVEEGAEA